MHTAVHDGRHLRRHTASRGCTATGKPAETYLKTHFPVGGAGTYVPFRRRRLSAGLKCLAAVSRSASASAT